MGYKGGLGWDFESDEGEGREQVVYGARSARLTRCCSAVQCVCADSCSEQHTSSRSHWSGSALLQHAIAFTKVQVRSDNISLQK